ncbi:MAG: LLM class flavin-dependent oxidoreductase [Candidatus Thorarchaeota archaeon]|jgi:5,10-methylenetetrahydromethanopterin reductase
MKGYKEFGMAMTGVFPVQDGVELAKLSEASELGSVWFAEDYFFRGGIPYMAAASMVTKKIRIGLGVVNPYSRHPALTAMEFATIDEMCNKRAIFGLGSGVPFWMDQMGLWDKKPISRTRESIEVIRKIMTGESITHKGKYFETKAVKLIFEPVRKEVPIYLAFEGKQGLKLAGEIGEGAIMSIFCTPAYTKFAWERVKAGAKEEGKSLEDFEMVGYLPVVLDDDLDKAYSIAREFSKLYLPHSQPGGPLMEHAGVKPEDTKAFNEAAEAGDDTKLGELITDKMLQELCVVGDVESCIKQIQDMIDAGTNTPVAFPVPGTDPIETAKVIGKEIAPHLK